MPQWHTLGDGGAGGQRGYGLPSLVLARTIGTTMTHFNQAVGPQGGGAGLTGNKTALSTGKGFDQD
jgi:hypothetical protein